jgi:hypothetical protein
MLSWQSAFKPRGTPPDVNTEQFFTHSSTFGPHFVVLWQQTVSFSTGSQSALAAHDLPSRSSGSLSPPQAIDAIAIRPTKNLIRRT